MSNRIQIKVQKVLASLTMTTTVLSLAGFAALTPVTALAVVPADYGLREGDTISAVGSNDPDIYIVNDWGYKRLFVNPAIFTLYGHLSWAGVKSVAGATRDAFGTSGLFRNCETGDQKVYGLEVVAEDVANLRWVNTSGAQAVIDDPMFFRKVFCINTREQMLYGVGPDYTSVLQVPVYVRGGQASPTPTQVQGVISASLSSDNPAANTLIAGQAAGDLAHFTFSGTGTVTSVTLNRIGVSADTTLTNVYLYNGSKRLTDSATVSQGKITFSDTAGLFTVNGSTNISVKADIAASTSGQTVGVQLATFNGISSTLTGNLFTIATAPSNFATVAVGAPTPSAGTTLDPQNDYAMWQSIVTVGNQDVWLKSLQLRVIGSVTAGDLRNFRLYVDGVQVGSAIAMQDANGYLVFDLGAGVKLLAGSRTLKLIGDVVGGSNKNFIISLRQKPDIAVIDSQYGQGVLVTGTFPATAPTQTLGTEVQAINVGSLTITKMTDSPSGDVVKDGTSQKLVSYKFEAFGESLKIENLRATFTASTDALASLRNAGIFADGVQIGSLASLCEDTVSLTASCSAGTAYTEFSLGSSLVVVPGTPRIIDIRSDIYDNTGTNNATAGVTIIAKLIAGSSNVQRLASLNYFSNTAPSVGSTLTIQIGSFTMSKYNGYANQSIVTPQTAFKVGHFNMSAATSEDINVNTLLLEVLPSSASAFTAADLTNVFLKVYDDTGVLRTTTTPKSTISATPTSNSYSVNFTIPKTKVWTVEVYADIGSATDTDSIITRLAASGLTAGSSATSVSAAGVNGQIILSSTGALNLANGSTPASRLVYSGQQTVVYAFTLQPQFDNFTLDEAVFNLSSTLASSSGAVLTAYLKEGTTLIGTAPAITNASSVSISFVGLNRPVTQAGGAKTFTVEVKFANVGVGANDTAGLVLVQLSHLKYRNGAGAITTSVVDPATYRGTEHRLTAAHPVFTDVALPSTILAPGEKTLFKTNVSSAGTGLVWRKIVFTIGVTANPTLTNFKLFENGVDISSLASGTMGGNDGLTLKQFATNSNGFSTAGPDGDGTVTFVFNSDRAISGTTTLELKGTVGGANVAGDSISTSIANPNGSTFVASDDVLTLGGLVVASTAWRTDINPSFLWSDSSAASHASTTDDWMGDGLVITLGGSQALYQ